MGSEFNVPGMVPVTKDDPLGALSQPDSGDFKTPTREKAVGFRDLSFFVNYLREKKLKESCSIFFVIFSLTS